MKKSRKEILIAQNKFLGVCPVCGQRLRKVPDVNILRCENNFCKGVPSPSTPGSYEPFYRILSDKAMKTYGYLFKNKYRKSDLY